MIDFCIKPLFCLLGINTRIFFLYGYFVPLFIQSTRGHYNKISLSTQLQKFTRVCQNCKATIKKCVRQHGRRFWARAVTLSSSDVSVEASWNPLLRRWNHLIVPVKAHSTTVTQKILLPLFSFMLCANSQTLIECILSNGSIMKNTFQNLHFGF